LVYQVTAVRTMDSIINNQFRVMYRNLLYIAIEGLPANGAVLQVLSSPLHMVSILTSGLLGRLWYVLLDVVTIF